MSLLPHPTASPSTSPPGWTISHQMGAQIKPSFNSVCLYFVTQRRKASNTGTTPQGPNGRLREGNLYSSPNRPQGSGNCLFQEAPVSLRPAETPPAVFSSCANGKKLPGHFSGWENFKDGPVPEAEAWGSWRGLLSRRSCSDTHWL